jgi:hypothetical protein
LAARAYDNRHVAEQKMNCGQTVVPFTAARPFLDTLVASDSHDATGKAATPTGPTAGSISIGAN